MNFAFSASIRLYISLITTKCFQHGTDIYMYALVKVKHCSSSPLTLLAQDLSKKLLNSIGEKYSSGTGIVLNMTYFNLQFNFARRNRASLV